MIFPTEKELSKMHPLKQKFYRRAMKLRDQGYPEECYDIKARIRGIIENETPNMKVTKGKIVID